MMGLPTWRKVVGIILVIAAAISATLLIINYVRVTQANHYYSLGLKALSDGRYSEAIHYFIKSLSYDPSNWMVWYDLGVAASEPDIFHRYFKICGEDFTSSNHPAMQVMFELARKAFKECMRLSKDCVPLAHFGLGNMYFDYYCHYVNRVKYVLHQYLEALKGKDLILKYLGREGLAALYTNLARVYLAMAEVDKARYYYRLANKLYPIDTAYEHLMWVELEEGNYSGVLKLMRVYVKLWSEEADLALAPAAIAAFHLGRYGDVIKYANEIIKKFPESAYVGEAYRLLAEVAIKEGKVSEAIKYLRQDVKVCSDVLDISSLSIPSDVPGAFYERGVAYYKLAEVTGNKTYYELAAKDFKWLIDHPKVSNREVAHRNYYLLAHAGLACTYAKLGKFDEAKELLKDIISKLRTDPNFTGWRKLVLGTFQKLYDEVSKGKAPELPHELTELEH